jgi:hypothetical protein
VAAGPKCDQWWRREGVISCPNDSGRPKLEFIWRPSCYSLHGDLILYLQPTSGKEPTFSTAFLLTCYFCLFYLLFLHFTFFLVYFVLCQSWNIKYDKNKLLMLSVLNFRHFKKETERRWGITENETKGNILTWNRAVSFVLNVVQARCVQRKRWGVAEREPN